ncbi:hypothetical protein EVAR_5984_1 [Eumeta japonica]|uniref:Uncharacterized protein n=1 Tax=Eumeta variegata TaxID=151549 RepID=A0A4C1TCL6_EUMVA|nr:hypothetical protein EVAR_5984_1 [Eumeta japonica]
MCPYIDQSRTSTAGVPHAHARPRPRTQRRAICGRGGRSNPIATMRPDREHRAILPLNLSPAAPRKQTLSNVLSASSNYVWEISWGLRPDAPVFFSEWEIKTERLLSLRTFFPRRSWDKAGAASTRNSRAPAVALFATNIYLLRPREMLLTYCGVVTVEKLTWRSSGDCCSTLRVGYLKLFLSLERRNIAIHVAAAARDTSLQSRTSEFVILDFASRHDLPRRLSARRNENMYHTEGRKGKINSIAHGTGHTLSHDPG